MKAWQVLVTIDRPIGYVDAFKNVYPINYGYIEGVMGGDGEEQDAYVVDCKEVIKEYKGKVIAIIHRKDDVECKWVVSNTPFTKEEIWNKVSFMEQYFDAEIEMLEL